MDLIHLSNPDHGWIDITFSGSSGFYSMCVSDVPNDCLRDLLVATFLLDKGSRYETVDFSLEPDFAKCDLQRDKDQLSIQIRMPGRDEPVFADTFSFSSFVARLSVALERIKPAYAEDDAWTQPFPEEILAKLQG